MKFNVLGREVEVGWKHFAALVVVVLAFCVPFFAMGFLYSFAIGNDFLSTAGNLLATSSPYLTLFGLPLFAFLLIFITRYFGMKKDMELCRSLAMAEFILFGAALALFGAIAYAFTAAGKIDPTFLLFNIISMMIGSILSAAFGAVVLYLWLLLFLELKPGKLKITAWKACAFAILFFFLLELFDFISIYQSGGIFAPNYNPGLLALFLASNFIFGFVVLYHASGSEPGKNEYVFAALYLLPAIFVFLKYLVFELYGVALIGQGFFQPTIDAVMVVGESALVLGLLYVLAGIKFEKD